MKLCVLIAAHTHGHVAGLTVGSFLRTHRPAHEVEVHVGVHAKCDWYNQKGIELLDTLRGAVAGIHEVEEIDWLGQYNACWFRYSVMHAKSLENLLRKIVDKDFDYAVVLDHDLHVHKDFVSECLSRNPGVDLAGCLFEDFDWIRGVQTSHDGCVFFLPKVSVWHLLLSKRFVQAAVKDPSMIYPALIQGELAAKIRVSYGEKRDHPVFADTFAFGLYEARNGNPPMKAAIHKSEEFAQWVTHFGGCSFNYGLWDTGPEKYKARIEEVRGIYQKEFPNGLAEFRK